MLSIRNIVKEYEHHRALNNVSMEIPSGSIFGLLGPNGAGKTSLIRIINQITAPDSGEVYFNGELLKPAHISRIGYLPEERGLYKKMEVGEQVLYLAQLKGLSKAEALKRIRFWFEKLEIQSWWKKKIEELSKGMQQKVQFVATVLHEPELLILDEPFSGFDPINAELIKNELLELNQKGTTIIFSTHRMESVEELCDSIALINKSEKILEGRVTEIKDRYRSNTFQIDYRGTIPPELLSANHFELLSEQVENGRTNSVFRIEANKTANDLVQAVLPYVQLEHLEEQVPSINEIFIRQVKGEI